LDGALLWQIADPNDLASGRWYFDYATTASIWLTVRWTAALS
jgi:hypothetical protein